MKYRCTIEINQPIDRVVALWNDESQFKNWQDGFQSITLLSGDKGKEGAKSRIRLKDGKRKMELIETVISNNLPDEKTALYEHIHMSNTQASRFEALSPDKTLYTSEVEYIKFNGFMPKMMAKFFPGVFKKQSQKWMNQFKAFAESYKD